ncbi:MAG: CocE/NonD family hydrolase, partial [Streptosporangiaceae bacterium]
MERAGSARRLPLRVRLMTRLSGRGLPGPVCQVAVERGIAVPAGDGVLLLTDHYVPLTREPAPTLLVRSPYGRRFPWDFLLGSLFAGQGFHVVLQSCRGTGGSGGRYEPLRNEAADGQAAVAWLRSQPWFTGVLGTIGPSYLGYVQWALAADPPPELRAMVVQVGMADLYEFLYRGGSLALEGMLVSTVTGLEMGRGFWRLILAMLRLQRRWRRVERVLPVTEACPAAIGRQVDFVDRWLAHPDRGDPFWDGLDAGRAATESAVPAVPVHLMTGWHDILLDQNLEQYRRLRALGRPVRLLIGPWTHTSPFDEGLPVIFPAALDWLRAHLLDPAAAGGGPPGGPVGSDGPPVRVYVTGANQWRDLPDWPPPARPAQWFTDADGSLRPRPPAALSASGLRYDPAAPTPSVGGQVLDSRRSGPVRNDRLEARPDVLTFTSEPLAEAAEVIGEVSTRVRARASGQSFDVFARLCDVDERGRSTSICDGLVRVAPAAG